MQKQIQNSGNPIVDLSSLTREETLELSSILVRKVWARRSGVLQTSNRFARKLLELTASKLEHGERDTRRLPERSEEKSSTQSIAESSRMLEAVRETTPTTSISRTASFTPSVERANDCKVHGVCLKNFKTTTWLPYFPTLFQQR